MFVTSSVQNHSYVTFTSVGVDIGENSFSILLPSSLDEKEEKMDYENSKTNIEKKIWMILMISTVMPSLK